jgi:acyl-CoA thioesterase
MEIKEINEHYTKVKGFDYTNNIVFDEVTKEVVKAHIDVSKASLNPWGTVHGGLIFGLADTAIGLLCYVNDYKGVTIDGNINYLKPCKKETKVVASIVKMGHKIGFYRAEVFNEDDELAAIMTSNYYNLND